MTDPSSGLDEERFEQVLRPKFDDYARKYSDWYTMRRIDGIIEITIGGARGKTPNNLNQVFWEVGNDSENRVMILTAAGDHWFNHPEDLPALKSEYESRPGLHEQSQRAHFMQRLRLLQNLIFEIDIPTIGAINGPDARDIHT